MADYYNVNPWASTFPTQPRAWGTDPGSPEAALPSLTGQGGVASNPDYWKAFNPLPSVRPTLAGLGLSSAQGNPWVQLLQQRIAPGLPLIWELGRSEPGSVAGFGDYLRNVLGGPGLTYQQFGGLVSRMLNPAATGNAALQAAFGQNVDPNEQYEAARKVLMSGAAQMMSPLGQQAMAMDLRDKWEQWAGLLNENPAMAKDFINWLSSTNYFRTWFPGQ